MNISKYFAYHPENDSLVHAPALHDEWLDAAKEAMHDDLYAFELRRLAIKDFDPEATEAEDIGSMALWVKSSSHGNNAYGPEGITHRDFTGITSSNSDDDEAEEECLREYCSRGDRNQCHPRHFVVVAEAVFNQDGKLIELDGITEDLPDWNL